MSYILDTGQQSIYKEFDLGSFAVAMGWNGSSGTAWGQASFPGFITSFAKEIGTNFSSYADFYWDVHELSPIPVQHAKARKFATVSALYNFLRSVCTEETGFFKYNVVVRLYSNQSREVPAIGRIYGQNTLYSNLRGRSNYRNSLLKCVRNPAPQRWPGFSGFWDTLCNQELGFPAGDTYTPGPAETKHRAIWFPVNEKKKYGLPVDGFAVNTVVTNYRQVYQNTGTPGWVTAPISSYVNAVNAPYKNYTKKYAYISTINNTQPTVWQTNAMNVTRDAVLNPNMSVVVVYGIHDGDNYAVYIKPLGIDKAGLSWFDDNLYDLYVLYYLQKDLSPRIRKVDLTLWGFANSTNRTQDLSWIFKQAWFPPELDHLTARFSPSGTGKTMPIFRFFLVDKATGRSGLLSRNYIYPQRRATNSPLRWEIRG